MTATLLPLPDDVRLAQLLADWPFYRDHMPYPRSKWLRSFEDVLRQHYPQANAKSLSLTARTHAPFALAQPGVP